MSANQPAAKPSGGTGMVIGIVGGVVGLVVFIFCVLPICVIAILTLLGPQIGNVFSKITNGLSAP